ncbi:MAG: ornithine cyclodeaminase, partial [Alphaproteobacteria bacterium]|nr:ornithine cyclodeaminase [Alphaproteobacteria bacterium]
ALGLPSVQGAMLFFDETNGSLKAIIDSAVVTKWKTAADSVLGARFLARPDSERVLIVGAGAVAETLISAYCEVFPNLKHIGLWNRTKERAAMLAQRMQSEGIEVIVENDLAKAAGHADIISTATMAHEPVLLGDWVGPGTHVDLIGAFKADMREADDTLLQKARLFVDSRETTLDHIGEMMIPLANGIIQRDQIIADLYELCAGTQGRLLDDDITVFKNGGGAHLDLMTANAMLEVVDKAPSRIIGDMLFLAML